MKKYLKLLETVSLFHNIKTDDLLKIINCLGAHIKDYKKDDIIQLAGEPVTQVGIILAGKIQVIREDFIGNRLILADLSEGDLFSETFAFADVEHSPVSVLASSDCRILAISFQSMVRCCSSACDFHFKLIENMLKIVAEKNIRLNEKIILLSRRTIREKVLYYLLAESGKSENRIITIPFNRNELADYICVDRSALSRELCKMRNEGMIDFHKNRFKLLDIDKIKNVIGED